MSGFLKTVWMSTLAHWHFLRKYTGFVLQSTTESLSTHSLLTQLACVRLTGFWPLSLQGMSGQGWAVQKIGTFTEQKATLCDPPHPPGDNAWVPPMVAAGSQVSGLSTLPSLTEPPLSFQAPQRPPCRLSPAGRQKSFASNSTPFWKIQTYIDIEFLNFDLKDFTQRSLENRLYIFFNF